MFEVTGSTPAGARRSAYFRSRGSLWEPRGVGNKTTVKFLSMTPLLGNRTEQIPEISSEMKTINICSADPEVPIPNLISH